MTTDTPTRRAHAAPEGDVPEAASRGGAPAPVAGAEAGPPAGFMTADMIAADLARITGKKAVPASTIRAMASRGQLPAPTAHKWGRRILWDATDIRAWLAQREARFVPPAVVRQVQRRLTVLDEQSRASGNDARLKQGVRNAYRRGLSLQQIADAIKVKNGDHHPTREAVRTRFGPYL